MDKIFKNKWGWVIACGGVIVFIFFLLRLVNLTIIPIFADEAIYIRWSQVMKAEPTLRFLPLSDGKQPLFMWLLMPVLTFFSDPLVAGRILSVLAGLGTLVGLFSLTYLLFRSKKIALAASFLYAIVPYALFFDRLALVDSLLSMFGVWFLTLAVLLTQYRRLDLAMVTGIVLGGALLTKSPALFFAMLLPLTVLLMKAANFQKFKWSLLKQIGLWALVYLFGFSIYNLLRLGPNFHMVGLRNQDYVFSFSEVLSHPLDPFIPHIGQVWEWFSAFYGWPLILIFIGGLGVGAKKWPKQTLVLLGWFLFPTLAQMAIAKVFTARYLFFTVPYFLILASLFLTWLWEKVNSQQNLARRGGALLLIVLAIIPLLLFNYQLLTNPPKAALPKDERRGYLEEWTSGYGINEVRDYLKNLPKQDKQIIVGTEGYFGTLPDGLMIYFDKDPKITIVGVGLGLSKIPEPLVDSVSQGNLTYLVINRSRINMPENQHLNLLFAIPKAAGEKQPDALLFYQVK